MMLEKYLEKLEVADVSAGTEETLFELHRRQAFRIPFENLTPFLGEPVLLDPESLFKKLVASGRGGYCFELNGLFSWALTSLKFSPVPLIARVQWHNPAPGPLAHHIMLVTVGTRKWLCDVGFGGPGLRCPMPFEMNRIETQSGEEYRLIEGTEYGYSLEQKQQDGSWLPLYYFNTTRISPADFVMGNHFTSTWPGSIFRKSIMCMKPFEDGRATIVNREFRRYRNGDVAAKKIASGQEFVGILRNEFSIQIDPASEKKLSEEFDKRVA